MRTQRITVLLLGMALGLTTVFTFSSSGCGSTPNNSPDASHPDGAKGSGGTTGSGSGGTQGSGGSKGGGGASGSGGTAGDSGIPDTGTCKSDSSDCNSCYTASQAAADPYNACSAYTKNCQQFKGTVPAHPTL